MRQFLQSLAVAAMLAAASFVASPEAGACSRILYVGADSTLRIVGRSLDWRTPIPTDLYGRFYYLIFQTGASRQNLIKPRLSAFVSCKINDLV